MVGRTWGRKQGGQTDEIELVSGEQADAGSAAGDFFLVLGICSRK
jgi:hypothetical protein